MKSNVMPSRVQLEPVVLQKLVTEVKETVAAGFKLPEVKKSPAFKAIDLWNIQRKASYANKGQQRKRNVSPSFSHLGF